jgi:hypothetical protein
VHLHNYPEHAVIQIRIALFAVSFGFMAFKIHIREEELEHVVYLLLPVVLHLRVAQVAFYMRFKLLSIKSLLFE